MTDVFTRSKRREVMSKIRGRDTQPERTVRSALHRAGLRFSTRRRDLPGRPDLVLAPIESAIFVHGCFWHGHPGCRYAAWPASNREFWRRKITETRRRDERCAEQLRHLGWRVFILWACQLDGTPLRRLTNLLLSRRSRLRSARDARRRRRRPAD